MLNSYNCLLSRTLGFVKRFEGLLRAGGARQQKLPAESDAQSQQ